MSDLSDQEKRHPTSNQLVKDFVQESSSHGIKRIFFPVANGGATKFGQTVWCLAWLMAAAYSIYQIYDVITDYLAYNRSNLFIFIYDLTSKKVFGPKRF